jgi:hypothetical protein
MLENEGDLTCNLTESQWLVVHDLHILLKLFTIAQRHLEGDAYVAISVVPHMVYKVRKGLQHATESPTSTAAIKGVAAEMVMVFNTHFAWGVDGTIANKITTWHQETSHRNQNVSTNEFLLGS